MQGFEICQRTDWLMRQFCDDIAEQFASGAIGHAQARGALRSRLVPDAVAVRILRRAI